MVMYYCNKDHGFKCTPFWFPPWTSNPCNNVVCLFKVYIYKKNIKCQIFALIKIFLNLNMNFEYFISQKEL